MNKIVRTIKAERERQVSKERWSAAHDDEHVHGELAQAAACYATPVELFAKRHIGNCTGFGGGLARYVDAFPHTWDKRWDKRYKHTRERQLIIAGALIVAELERLERKKERKKLRK